MQPGHAAYCDTCDKFDEAMKVKRGRPHCRFCGTAIPAPAVIVVPQHWSEFLFSLVQRVQET